MLIYSASVVFLAGDITKNYPVCSTSCTYTSFEAFLNFCFLEAQNCELFEFSNISISAMEVIQLPHNKRLCLQKKKEINIENYNPIKAKLYLNEKTNGLN